MSIVARLCAISALAFSLTQHSAAIAAPLKNTKVIKNFVRQCEYADGVILRVLFPRECPVLETAAPVSATVTPSVPAVAMPQALGSGVPKAAQTINSSLSAVTASNDIILDKAISRCTSIGYKRKTAEFRSCVTEQITLLSK